MWDLFNKVRLLIKVYKKVYRNMLNKKEDNCIIL